MSSSSSSSVAKKKKKPRKVRLPHHLHPNKNSIEIINLCESDSDNDNARTPPTSLQQRVAAALLPSAPPPDSVLNTLLQDLASHNETAGKSTKHTGNCAERLCENGGEKGRRDGGGGRGESATCMGRWFGGGQPLFTLPPLFVHTCVVFVLQL